MAKRTDDGYQRYEYIYEMERLYLQRSFSDVEMGEYLGTDRTNVYRIRKIMTEMMGIPIEPAPDARGQYYIHPDYNIRHIPFSDEQMVQLYLAGRRLQQQTRTSQRDVVDALEKLSHAMRKPLASSMVRAAQAVVAQEQDPQQEDVFATLVECWLKNIPVRITHRKHHGQPRIYRVHPYQLEPSVWGDGTYLIGHSEYHGKLATFKLARIEKAVPSTGQFEIPADFDVHELLNHAWGVWHADEEPVTVRLRFKRWVTPRVRETIWHPQQRMTFHKDGSSTWEAPVAEWREMEPWVRGWGSDCEVLEPLELHRRIVKDLKRSMQVYGISTDMDVPLVRQLWAKTSKDGRQTHPLVCHLLDVAQVALQLWDHVLTESVRIHFASALGITPEEAGRTIAFWVGLHDLGKACPGFQRLYQPAVETLASAGLPFPEVHLKERCYHATITTCTLDGLLVEETGLPRKLARRMAQALGGHHGSWPPPAQVHATKQNQIGDKSWHTLRRELVCVLRDLLQPCPVSHMGRDRTEENTFLTLFSGLTTAADWIGSMETYFPYVDAPVDLADYMAEARGQAEHALEQLGWTGWQPPQSSKTFEELFPFAPNAVQREAIELAPKLNGPALIIVEALTGAGKSETAFYLADYQAATQQQRGLYIAMPTMATSNQMFDRASEFLHARYPDQSATPLLIHSQARWMQEELPELDIHEAETNAENNRASMRDMSWFLPRKRSLLAPFGVGTVDQALLSVLQTRHFFVRLFALSHKTIIFDEVHAYDTYMSELFQQLLGWLRMVGATVILLSATLPAATRRRLVAGYLGDDRESDAVAMPEVPYPAMTWVRATTAGDADPGHGRIGVIPLPSTAQRAPIALDWIDRTPQAVVNVLTQRLREGGCAAVICNTIARAQEVYRALATAGLVPADDLLLFHARNPFAWRDQTEGRVLERFGKDGEETGQRPGRSIVVATQVIEQSLDLDFDLMISDLAPVDLLIQRAGRLHRHERDKRPAGLVTPTLFVAVDMEGEAPEFGSDQYIYERYILLRSYLALYEQTALRFPEQTSALIEAVYGEEAGTLTIPAALQPAMDAAYETMVQNNDKASRAADTRLILPPSDESLLYQRSPGLEEDSPELHAAFQALTRLGDRSVPVVCLHQLADGTNTETDGSGTWIDLDESPNPDAVRELARYTVSISNKALVFYLLRECETPRAWRDHALLRNHFVLIFTDGAVELAPIKTTLRLSREYGLEILKEEA